MWNRSISLVKELVQANKNGTKYDIKNVKIFLKPQNI